MVPLLRSFLNGGDFRERKRSGPCEEFSLSRRVRLLHLFFRYDGPAKRKRYRRTWREEATLAFCFEHSLHWLCVRRPQQD